MGLPEVLRELEREEARIVVRVEHRRFQKAVTIISGLDPKATDIRGIAKALKTSMASGGTVKGNEILLQGDHREQVREKLVELGFKPERIEVQPLTSPRRG
ncbi:MAG: stress response translation initiation inhibitor YciH [Candidatus Bathyarchaeia archaeon]